VAGYGEDILSVILTGWFMAMLDLISERTMILHSTSVMSLVAGVVLGLVSNFFRMVACVGVP